MSDNAAQELAQLLRDLDVPVQIGLRQQGHIPTVERMLFEGRTWEEIGAAIGWDGKAAAHWYEMDRFAKAVRRDEAGRIRQRLLEAIRGWSATVDLPSLRQDQSERALGALAALGAVYAALDRICPEGGQPTACTWAEDEDGPWKTDCGHAFELNDGGPSENQMRFCCYCGRPLAEARFVPEPDEEETED